MELTQSKGNVIVLFFLLSCCVLKLQYLEVS